MKEQRKEDVFIMEYLTNIAKDQDNIFLSSTMTGNIQLLRLEHIGYFRYNSVNGCGKLPYVIIVLWH